MDNQESVITELTTGSNSAATEHTEEPQLAELVNQEAGSATEIELKVIRNVLMDCWQSPSKKKLTDQQRKTLLTNLLQSNSKSMPGRAIGKARFLLGGDMYTRHEHFTLSTPLCQPATE